MENNDKLKEFDIKHRMYYYFDDIIKIENFDFGNILIHEKSYENVLVCNISFVVSWCSGYHNCITSFN